FKAATNSLNLPGLPGQSTPENLDEITEKMESILVEVSDKYFPRCRMCTMSKRWWNETIKEKWKIKLSCKRDWFKHRDNDHHQRYKEARNDFLRTIRKSKTDSWNKYLSEVKGNQIWD